MMMSVLAALQDSHLANEVCTELGTKKVMRLQLVHAQSKARRLDRANGTRVHTLDESEHHQAAGH
jgi:hypothetical protein